MNKAKLARGGGSDKEEGGRPDCCAGRHGLGRGRGAATTSQAGAARRRRRRQGDDGDGDEEQRWGVGHKLTAKL